MIKVGSQAPDFTLKDQNNKVMKLSDLKGRRVLLSFRPLAWTPVCHDQMKSLEEKYDSFEKLNTVALGIGVDSAPSNKAWAQSIGIKRTKLLSDFWPHGEVSRAYGAFREADGFSERANILLNEGHKVIFAKLYDLDQLPDIEEVVKLLQNQPTLSHK